MTTKQHCAQSAVVDVFLWCLAAIYLFAFTSLYVQIPGLYGKDGILPARNVIHDLTACVDSDERCPMWESWGECKANSYWMLKHCRKSCNNCVESDIKIFFQEFNLLLITPYLGLDTETGMEFLCLVGMSISMLLLVSARMRNFFNFLLLFFLYYSQHKVGQIFLWYQWDALLLETGFLAIVIAPWNISFNFKNRKCFIQVKRSEYSPSDSISFWLVKWLLFRLMFSSGVVKLTYRDKTWWDLTALNWHYESQCIPSPLAWYFHHLPEWLQKFSVVMTYVIEIAIPFLFFSPLRCLRLFSAFSQIFLQILIFISGNYNFFNLITVVLCLSLVDDKFLGMTSNGEREVNQLSEKSSLHSPNKSSPGQTSNGETAPLLSEDDDHENKTPEKENTKVGKLESLFNYMNEVLDSRSWRISRTVIKVLTVLTVVVLFSGFTVKWFSLRIASKEPIQSKIAFSVDDFFSAVKLSMCLSMVIGLLSLLVEICKAFWRCLHFESKREKWLQIFKSALISGICLMMFGLSLVLYTGEIDKNVQKTLPQFLVNFHDRTYHLEMVHSYGLFRSMTGVGGRPEVVIKGGDTPTGPWKEYDFLYKPGDLNKRPPFVAPHQPRLDWQMWFASLGSYDRNPWFLSLLLNLLLGKPDVLGLLDRGPFETALPQFIKVDLYRYHFTSNKTSFWNALAHSSEKSWWSREFVSDYTPFIINRNDSKSYETLLKSRFNLPRTDVSDEHTFGLLYNFVHSLRSPRQGRLGPRLILILFTSSLVLLATKLWWKKKGHVLLSPFITKLINKIKEPGKKLCKSVYQMLNPRRKRLSCYLEHKRQWLRNFKKENLKKMNKTYLKWRKVKIYSSLVKSRSNVECPKKTA